MWWDWMGFQTVTGPDQWTVYLHSSSMGGLSTLSVRQSVMATSSHAGCATAEEMLLARDVLTFFGCQVEAALHMDSVGGARDLQK